MNGLKELAEQAGLRFYEFVWTSPTDTCMYPEGVDQEALEAFAKLVAAKEREACAKLVEDSWMAFSRASNRRLDITPFPELEYVAKVIRARGEA